MSISIQQNLNSFLRALSRLLSYIFRKYFEASKLNIEANINFFITNVYRFFYLSRRKTTTIYKRRVKKIIGNEYKRRLFHELPVLYKHKSKTCLLCLLNTSEFYDVGDLYKKKTSRRTTEFVVKQLLLNITHFCCTLSDVRC